MISCGFGNHPKDQNGQGLIEYLIIVAIVAVASMGVLRVMGQSLTSRFANITYAIQGKSKRAASEEVEESYYRKKDLSDFFNGATKSER